MQENKDIENVVKEIMLLVGDVLDKREAYQDHQISRTWCEYESARGRLESKLRESVKNSFSVREPIGYAAGVQSDCKVTLFFDNKECAASWFESFTDSVDS